MLCICHGEIKTEMLIASFACRKTAKTFSFYDHYKNNNNKNHKTNSVSFSVICHLLRYFVHYFFCPLVLDHFFQHCFVRGMSENNKETTLCNNRKDIRLMSWFEVNGTNFLFSNSTSNMASFLWQMSSDIL